MAKAATAAKKPARAVKAAPAAAVARPSLKMIGMEAGDAKEVTSGLTTGRVFHVPIEKLVVLPNFNLRITDHPDYVKDLKDLAHSIDMEGFYDTKPLAGYAAKTADGTSHIVLTDGHRRLEAVKMLNAARAAGGNPIIDKLPLIFKKPTVTAADLTISLVQENSGRRLTMIENAVQAKRMIDGGFKKDEIAERLKIAPRYVEDLLLLIAADKDVRLLVMQGKIAGTEVVKRLRLANKEADKPGATAETKAAAKAAAAASMKELVTIAEAKGQAKVTAADAGDGEDTVKMASRTVKYAGVKGDTIAWAEVEPFARLMGDEDWYDVSEREGFIVLNESFSFKCVVRRPRKTEETEGEATPEPEPVKPAAKKPGRKAKGEGEVKATEVDPMTMGDLEADEAPDLRKLGIVDEEDGAAGL
jgi:ParB family chromosome partitioning protein